MHVATSEVYTGSRVETSPWIVQNPSSEVYIIFSQWVYDTKR